VRVLIWHGWLLEGSGSNVAAARTAEALRGAGHHVLLLCQERHPERYRWIDAFATLDGDGPGPLSGNGDVSPAPGRCTLLRPLIGSTLPVFVVDRYEGFDDVRAFVDLSDQQLERYLAMNAAALEAAAAWHGADAAIVGHAIPGAELGRRALGAGRYVAKIHGSDLEYAVRPQRRYRELAAVGLGSARAVVAPSREALDRCAALVPQMRGLGLVIAPGVDVAAFRLRDRREALLTTAGRLEGDPERERGRPSALAGAVASAVERRDLAALDALATAYDQEAPDRDAPARLRELAGRRAPLVGYLGKLIPQKGVELLLAAHRAIRHDAELLVVGFGSHRERLEAYAQALAAADAGTIAWLHEVAGMPAAAPSATAPERRVTFTGRLDHRYAPGALAAMDVQVVPSVLAEAFGMVAAEGAAAGALPLLASHSGLAEVAAALEAEIGRPGLLSFEAGEEAFAELARGIDRLLSLPADERVELRAAVSAFVAREWTWERTASRLLEAASGA
jgi:glycosyltransferase involved in cell wall biosynthesis